MVEKFKAEFKDRHELSHLSFRSKDKMSSIIEKVNFDFKNAETKQLCTQFYQFKENKFDEPSVEKNKNK